MRKRPLCLILVSLLLWLMGKGMTAAGMPDEASRPCPPGSVIRVKGTVCGQETKEAGQSIILKNISVLSKASESQEAAYTDTKKRILVYLETHTLPEIGKQVQVSGICTYPSAPENPGGFDALSYYGGQNVGMILKKGEVERSGGRTEILRQGLSCFRQKAAKSLDRINTKEDKGILRAMLLGDRSSLETEMKDLFQDNGIIHILAISGLHISLLGMGLYHVLRKVSLSCLQASIGAGSVMACYGVMTGMSFSVLRAVLMFVIFLGAQVAGRTYDLPTALMAAAAVILLQNPSAVTQAGFLLSFGAVAGVAAAACWNHPLLYQKPLGVSLSVSLVTLPMAAWFYYRISLTGTLLNLLVVPMMPLILGFGGAGMIAGMFSPRLGIFVTAPAHYLLYAITFLGEKIRRLPFSTVTAGRPSTVQILVYYLFLLIFFCFFRKKRKIDLIHRTIGIILFICIILYKEPAKWTLTFLNVGQGDACCIRTAEGRVWMIDGGSGDHRDLARYSLRPYLAFHGLDTVDYWLVTHFDQDHISALRETLLSYEKNALGKNMRGITICQLLFPDTFKGEASDSGAREELEKLAKKQGIPIRRVGKGDCLVQDGTIVRILGPEKGAACGDGNETSVVAEVSYRSFRALLTGDVEGMGERSLTEDTLLRDVDVLKVAHHGSKNSTGREFLLKTMPETAVISCGENNRYGHPHRELLERLFEAGSRVLRTDRTGAVDIAVTEEGYEIMRAR